MIVIMFYFNRVNNLLWIYYRLKSIYCIIHHCLLIKISKEKRKLESENRSCIMETKSDRQNLISVTFYYICLYELLFTFFITVTKKNRDRFWDVILSTPHPSIRDRNEISNSMVILINDIL